MKKLNLFLFNILLLSSCMPVVTATPTLMPTKTATLTPTSTPTPTPKIYTLRIEFSTTSDWSTLSILDANAILEMHLISKRGNLADFSKTYLGINQTLADAKALKQVSATIDFDISGNATNNAIPFRLEKGAINDTAVRFYNVINGKAYLLLMEVVRKGEVPGQADTNPFEFSFELKSLFQDVALLSTPTTSPTTTPEPRYTRVTQPNEEAKMTILTLEDIQGGNLATWELSIAKDLGQITQIPSQIDFYLGDNIRGMYYLGAANSDGVHDIRNFDLFSIYRISMEPWDFPGIQWYGLSYVWEDKHGEKAMLHFVVCPNCQRGMSYLKQAYYFTDPKSNYLSPFDTFTSDSRVYMLFDEGAKPGGPNDLRPLADNIYTVQGYSKEDIQHLFTRIAERDTWRDDKEIIQSILFLAWPGRVVNVK